jgi:uncharacterized protein (DUF849 family)
MSLSEKLIINAAITGMVPTKQDNPHVPISPVEIAADARRCVDAGASIVHLHARDEQGEPSWRPDIYREILLRVREACPQVILCVSTSGRVFKSFEQRSAVLDIDDPKPEMASLTLGSMNFAKQESINSPEMIQSLARKMLRHGVLPELECFEIGMAEYTGYLIEQQILRPPLYCNILLGSRGTLKATEFNLRAAIAALPAGTTWAGAGIGRFQLEVNTMAIRLGGHVRIGLEDNLFFERGVPATNPMLIERIAGIGRSTGRAIASPAEARAIIGLRQPIETLESTSHTGVR